MKRNLRQIIDEQVVRWSTTASQFKEIPGEYWPVITISRQFGAGGSVLAQELGGRSSFSVWDKELVQAIADESGADQRIMETLDEHRRRATEDAVQAALLGSKHTNTQYVRALLRVVEVISAHGRSIIVGRGANYICRTQDALRVRVICSLDVRAARRAGELDITRKRARKDVQTRDEDRKAFIKQTFKKDVGDPSEYDLILNSGTYSPKKMTSLILAAYEEKFNKSPANVGAV